MSSFVGRGRMARAGGLVFHRLRAPVLLRSDDLFQADKGSVRHLNIFTVFSKEAREKERARLASELNRGYFDDFKDIKKTGGKVALASQNLLPVLGAVQFPKLTAFNTQGEKVVFPTESLGTSSTEQPSAPKRATLVCLVFRASGQGMIDSWTKLFMTSFHSSQSVELVQVSLVDSWFLSLSPVRSILLRTMRWPAFSTEFQPPRRTLYAFGDTYYFRKELGIPNVLAGFLESVLHLILHSLASNNWEEETSYGITFPATHHLIVKVLLDGRYRYVFLLDKRSRVRWRASGFATSEELLSMVSCVTRLLEEH